VRFSYTRQEVLDSLAKQKRSIPYFGTRSRLAIKLMPGDESLLIYDTDENRFYIAEWTYAATIFIPLQGNGNNNRFERIVALENIVTITHNLGYYPFIQIIDSSGQEVEADKKDLTINQFVVVFNKTFTGKIIYG
jgi:hypothetical protein